MHDTVNNTQIDDLILDQQKKLNEIIGLFIRSAVNHC